MEERGKRHPCYHDDQPSYRRPESYSFCAKYEQTYLPWVVLVSILSCKYFGIYDNTNHHVALSKKYHELLLLSHRRSHEAVFLSSKLCLSFRVTLPTKISPARTSAPIRIIPFSSGWVFERVVADTRYITGNLFITKLMPSPLHCTPLIREQMYKYHPEPPSTTAGIP